MLGMFLATNQQLANNLAEPGVFLFGALLVLFGMALPMVFLLRSQPFLSRPLFALLVIIEMVLLAILAVDFTGPMPHYAVFEHQREIVQLIAEHRWLLFQLPLYLTLTSAVLLLLYREEIAKDHARDYRLTVVLSVAVSFATVLVIALESLI